MEEKFIIALSKKEETDEAIKEISLKIKTLFSKNVNFLIILFTPHYHPLTISKTAIFTLNPKNFLAIQSPFLIFKEKIVERGIVGCCIVKKGLELREMFLDSDDPQVIEPSLYALLKDLGREKNFIISFLSHQFSPSKYLRGVELSLGKFFNCLGGGFIKRYSSRNYQIINNRVNESIAIIGGGGVKIDSLRIGGFIPVGKPFIITQSIKELITEIDGKPPINIYKKYLEDKFSTFVKNSLFPHYPLEIKENGKHSLVTVLRPLKDGSLICIGKVNKNSQGHLTILHPPFLFNFLKEKLESLGNKGEEGLIFIINSLTRKRILKEHSDEEIRLINYFLGEKFKIIGLYTDYTIFPSKERGEIATEAASILITLWK